MSWLNSFKISIPQPIHHVVSKDCPVHSIQDRSIQYQYQKRLEKQLHIIRIEKESLENVYIHQQEEQKKILQADLQRDLEVQVKLAFEDGRKNGIEQGRDLRTQELKAEVDLLSKMSQELQIAKSGMLTNAEEDILRLAVSIARKILQVEPQLNYDVVRKVVRVALEKMVDKSWVNIHLNPEDIHLVERELTDIVSSFKDLSKVSLQEDAMVDRGGCLIETRSGFIDARLETQLQKISEKLFAAMKKYNRDDDIEIQR